MGSVSNHSVFDAADYVEPDGIFEVLRRYAVDPFPDKVNVSAGAYRDGEGKPWFLPSVQMAKKKIAGSNHEYSPMMGFRPFRDACYELLLHDTAALAEGRVSHYYPSYQPN
jgi:aspartate/tyrosine/aromatic aminotransferase